MINHHFYFFYLKWVSIRRFVKNIFLTFNFCALLFSGIETCFDIRFGYILNFFLKCSCSAVHIPELCQQFLDIVLLFPEVIVPLGDQHCTYIRYFNPKPF